jgi:acetyl-CoA carboxylase carboxyltransferase component
VTSPFVAAGLGIIDDVILPEETRARLISALGFLARDRTGELTGR